jgi:hypothetical protein
LFPSVGEWVKEMPRAINVEFHHNRPRLLQFFCFFLVFGFLSLLFDAGLLQETLMEVFEVMLDLWFYGFFPASSMSESKDALAVPNKLCAELAEPSDSPSNKKEVTADVTPFFVSE